MKTTKLIDEIKDLKIKTEGLTTVFVANDFLYLQPDIERINEIINLKLKEVVFSEQKEFLETSKEYFQNKLLIINKGKKKEGTMKQKISLKGTPHNFQIKKVNLDKTEIMKCENCGIEGTHNVIDNYVEVKELKSTKGLIESCKPAQEEGEKEIRLLKFHGSIHNHKWSRDKENDDTTSIYKCLECGINGIRSLTNNFIEVVQTDENKLLIENCKSALEKTADISILPVGPEAEKKEDNMSIVPKPKTMNLKCEFTETQIREMSKELADSYLVMYKIEEEKKSANEEFKSRLARIETRVSELSHKIHDGCIYEDVEIEEKMNTPRMHEKTIIRLDTNVEIGVVPMEDEDYALFDNMQKTEEKKKKRSKKSKKEKV